MIGLIVARSKNNCIGKMEKSHGKLRASKNSSRNLQQEMLW